MNVTRVNLSAYRPNFKGMGDYFELERGMPDVRKVDKKPTTKEIPSDIVEIVKKDHEDLQELKKQVKKLKHDFDNLFNEPEPFDDDKYVG